MNLPIFNIWTALGVAGIVMAVISTVIYEKWRDQANRKILEDFENSEGPREVDDD